MDRGDAQPVTHRQALFGASALTVDAHLSLADQPEDAGPRDARQQSRQGLVEALAGFLVRHLELPDCAARSVRGP